MPIPAQQIEDAVVQQLLLAGVPGVDSLDKIYPRELPQRQKGDHDRSLIVVVGNDTPEKTGVFGQSNMTVTMTYPVLVLWTYKRAQSIIKSLPEKKEARYKIRTALWAHENLGLPNLVKRCDYISEPKFTAIGFDEGYKYSSQMFIYSTHEPRPPWSLA